MKSLNYKFNQKHLMKSFYILIIFFFSNYAIAESISIAGIFSKTGAATSFNESSIVGLKIAVNEINNNGGVLGKKINLLIIDNKSTAIGSKKAAIQAINSNVKAIIGSVCSTHSLMAAKVAQKYETPMITNLSINDKITKIGSCIFRTCFTDFVQAKAISSIITKDLKLKTAVIIKNVCKDYSIGLAEHFSYHFKKMGGKILFEISFINGNADLKNELEKIQLISPDIIYIPCYCDCINIVKQIIKMNISSTLIGGESWGGDEFYNNIGKDIKEAYYCAHWTDEVANKKSKDFVSAYSKIYKLDQGSLLSYDAFNILTNAIVTANSFKRKDICFELSRTHNYDGITGNISFNEFGDPLKNVIIIKIKNGKKYYYKTVKP